MERNPGTTPNPQVHLARTTSGGGHALQPGAADGSYVGGPLKQSVELLGTGAEQKMPECQIQAWGAQVEQIVGYQDLNERVVVLREDLKDPHKDTGELALTYSDILRDEREGLERISELIKGLGTSHGSRSLQAAGADSKERLEQFILESKGAQELMAQRYRQSNEWVKNQIEQKNKEIIGLSSALEQIESLLPEYRKVDTAISTADKDLGEAVATITTLRARLDECVRYLAQSNEQDLQRYLGKSPQMEQPQASAAEGWGVWQAAGQQNKSSVDTVVENARRTHTRETDVYAEVAIVKAHTAAELENLLQKNQVGFAQRDRLRETEQTLRAQLISVITGSRKVGQLFTDDEIKACKKAIYDDRIHADANGRYPGFSENVELEAHLYFGISNYVAFDRPSIIEFAVTADKLFQERIGTLRESQSTMTTEHAETALTQFGMLNVSMAAASSSLLERQIEVTSAVEAANLRAADLGHQSRVSVSETMQKVFKAENDLRSSYNAYVDAANQENADDRELGRLHSLHDRLAAELKQYEEARDETTAALNSLGTEHAQLWQPQQESVVNQRSIQHSSKDMHVKSEQTMSLMTRLQTDTQTRESYIRHINQLTEHLDQLTPEIKVKSVELSEATRIRQARDSALRQLMFETAGAGMSRIRQLGDSVVRAVQAEGEAQIAHRKALTAYDQRTEQRAADEESLEKSKRERQEELEAGTKEPAAQPATKQEKRQALPSSTNANARAKLPRSVGDAVGKGLGMKKFSDRFGLGTKKFSKKG